MILAYQYCLPLWLSRAKTISPGISRVTSASGGTQAACSLSLLDDDVAESERFRFPFSLANSFDPKPLLKKGNDAGVEEDEMRGCLNISPTSGKMSLPSSSSSLISI